MLLTVNSNWDEETTLLSAEHCQRLTEAALAGTPIRKSLAGPDHDANSVSVRPINDPLTGTPYWAVVTLDVNGQEVRISDDVAEAEAAYETEARNLAPWDTTDVDGLPNWLADYTIETFNGMEWTVTVRDENRFDPTVGFETAAADMAAEAARDASTQILLQLVEARRWNRPLPERLTTRTRVVITSKGEAVASSEADVAIPTDQEVEETLEALAREAEEALKREADAWLEDSYEDNYGDDGYGVAC